MARRISWAPIAWRDLEFAADYIARDSPKYAAVLVRDARDASRALAIFAERGRIVPELDSVEIRELLVGNYRMIYRVNMDAVNILAFVHGARDLSTVWKETPRD